MASLKTQFMIVSGKTVSIAQTYLFPCPWRYRNRMKWWHSFVQSWIYSLALITRCNEVFWIIYHTPPVKAFLNFAQRFVTTKMRCLNFCTPIPGYRPVDEVRNATSWFIWDCNILRPFCKVITHSYDILISFHCFWERTNQINTNLKYNWKI